VKRVLPTFLFLFVCLHREGLKMACSRPLSVCHTHHWQEIGLPSSSFVKLVRCKRVYIRCINPCTWQSHSLHNTDWMRQQSSKDPGKGRHKQFRREYVCTIQASSIDTASTESEQNLGGFFFYFATLSPL
jgi:hypothetical protein